MLILWICFCPRFTLCSTRTTKQLDYIFSNNEEAFESLLNNNRAECPSSKQLFKRVERTGNSQNTITFQIIGFIKMWAKIKSPPETTLCLLNLKDEERCMDFWLEGFLG
jgi:hypothetical protein